MVKHIVMFKLKESLSENEKIEIMNNLHVGLNINPSEKWDICLDSTFDSLEDVKAYSVHPDHVAAAGIIKDAKEDRACVDFEI